MKTIRIRVFVVLLFVLGFVSVSSAQYHEFAPPVPTVQLSDSCAGSSSTVTTFNCGRPITVTVGETVIAFLDYQGASSRTLSMSDTLGNTWVPLHAAYNTTSGFFGTYQPFASTITVAGSTTISGNVSVATGNPVLIFQVLTNVAPSPLDNGPFVNELGSAGTSVSVGSVATSSANDDLIAFTFNAATGQAFTPGAGFTQNFTDSAGANTIESMIEPTISSSLTVSQSYTISSHCGILVMAIKAAPQNTPSFVQSAAAANLTAGSGNVSVSAALGSSTPAGNTIIVDVDYDDTTNRTANLPTDDAGNTYHLYVGPSTCFGPTPPYNFDAQSIYWASNSTPGMRNITSTTTSSSGSSAHFIYVEELNNASATSPLVASSFSCSSPTMATSLSSLSIVLTTPHALVIGLDSTGGSVPSTSPPGWFQRYSAEIGGGAGLPFANGDVTQETVGRIAFPWTSSVPIDRVGTVGVSWKNASSQNHLMWDLIAVSDH